MDEIRHGTLTAYTNQRCRCDDCRRAMRDYCGERRARRRGAGIAAPVAPVAPPLGYDIYERALGDLLHELAPDGLTDDCPARRRIAA